MLRIILLSLLLISVYQTEAVVAQTRRNQQQRNANQQPTVSQTSVPLVEPGVEKSKPSDTGSRADNKTQITIDDTRSNVSTWVSVVLSFLLLVVIGFQAWIYKEQLREMRKLSRISHRQAYTLKRQVRAMQEANDSTRNLVDAARIQADAAKVQADASKLQADIARQALDDTRRSTIPVIQMADGISRREGLMLAR